MKGNWQRETGICTGDLLALPTSRTIRKADPRCTVRHGKIEQRNDMCDGWRSCPEDTRMQGFFEMGS